MSSQMEWKATAGQGAFFCCILLLLAPALCLNQDGALLLQFKYSVLSDPLSALGDWYYDDATPCSWNGVICSTSNDGSVETLTSRVIGLVLPNSKLLGRVPPELGLLEHLRHLDLSGNALNGSLPASIFNASELRVFSLADNEISGELPELDASRMSSLQVLNLSGNALEGAVPANLNLLPSLTVVSLANNYLSGKLPGGGFGRVEYVDLSSNLINGSLPPDLGGQRLRYLNLSCNRVAGSIPRELVSRIPANATVDLAFNNLTGKIPQDGAFATQKPTALAGNPDLCGKPLSNLCTVPSTLSNPPNSTSVAPLTASKSPPAFAVMPNDTDETSPPRDGQGQGGLRPAVVIAIAVGDVSGIGLLLAIFFYVYQLKKRNREKQQMKGAASVGVKQEPPASPETEAFGGLACCLGKKGDEEESEEASSSSVSTEMQAEEEGLRKGAREESGERIPPPQLKPQSATLVTIDGDPKLEMETLLKASAYVLGATGLSIVYKVVLADGTALAVRRIGESSAVDKLKDFDASVRCIAKYRHLNLLRLRGFYWGVDEKLLIHDFAVNGSLANILTSSKKLGSPALHLSWEARLRIARGVARGLAYLHEKKIMHGNVKPSNVLLDADMEPKLADFGLDRLISGDGGYRLSTSARLFGSKRAAQSQSSLADLSPAASAAVTEASPRASFSRTTAAAPYQAPESLKNLKPNAKWDVYAFGALLLELLAGRVMSEVELGQWAAAFVVEERNRMLRMADPAVRGEVEAGKEEALLSCFKLGFACCAVVPQRRPSMKEAVQVLEKILPSSSSSSSSS
ncbi:putative LRR receptor-like serine/threonine-protein kinase [Canna indica]|uniref:non-specific serine/threonine protein kinase n=1 Tax=Canna indica TaxID=4628 RepID=A0AAQ3L3C6_9LILI|nr:putative LRR receptor-like serine/threonine-protein kinase [Canna indica]